ncbi:MAG TPA: helix-turn-helix transcriptional regulator [Ktedonobacterales bacterium]|nr:helix-turn-helix transcriptional regulator [Ktedonobacterales bacterium]
MSKGVANRLRDLRQSYGLTQEQLAHDLDVTRHTILALEVGRYVPSIELALKLAAYFDQPLETIFWLPADEVAELRALRARRLRPEIIAGAIGPANGHAS